MKATAADMLVAGGKQQVPLGSWSLHTSIRWRGSSFPTHTKRFSADIHSSLCSPEGILLPRFYTLSIPFHKAPLLPVTTTSCGMSFVLLSGYWNSLQSLPQWLTELRETLRFADSSMEDIITGTNEEQCGKMCG